MGGSARVLFSLYRYTFAGSSYYPDPECPAYQNQYLVAGHQRDIAACGFSMYDTTDQQ